MPIKQPLNGKLLGLHAQSVSFGRVAKRKWPLWMLLSITAFWAVLLAWIFYRVMIWLIIAGGRV